MVRAKVPSVTEILKPYQDFSRVNPSDLELAADRGSIIHTALACRAAGLWYAVKDIPKEYMGYFRSGCRWLDRYVKDVKLVEIPLVHKEMKFRGTPDLICILKGDEAQGIWDYKTGALAQRTWEVQVGGYVGLCMTNAIPVGRAGFIQLRRDGKIPKVTDLTSRMYYLWTVFHAFLRVHQFLNEG
jgi:hypothetical protein